MTITYRKGPENQADALSRLPHLSHLQLLTPVARTLLHQLADLLPTHLILMDSTTSRLRMLLTPTTPLMPSVPRSSSSSPTTSGTSTPASASPPTLPFAATSFTSSMTPLPLDTLATPRPLGGGARMLARLAVPRDAGVFLLPCSRRLDGASSHGD